MKQDTYNLISKICNYHVSYSISLTSNKDQGVRKNSYRQNVKTKTNFVVTSLKSDLGINNVTITVEFFYLTTDI